jgi:hypothetical protein
MRRTSLAELAVFEHAGAALAPRTGGLPGPSRSPMTRQIRRLDEVMAVDGLPLWTWRARGQARDGQGVCRTSLARRDRWSSAARAQPSS